MCDGPAITLIFILIAGTASTAQGAFDARWEIYGSTTHQQWNREAPVNSENAVLKVPTWNSVLELRPDFSLKGRDHELVLRSRHFVQNLQREYTEVGAIEPTAESTTEGHSDLSDLYWSGIWHDKFSTTIGLQNYQWGSAEIFSPSNPFFHFESEQRSFFFKQKGLVLVRANWNPTESLSVILLAEPMDNRTRPWVDDPEFRSRGAVKIDYQFENPVNSISFIASQAMDGSPFFGETVSVAATEGISFYADARHTQGFEGYRPIENAFGLYDMQRDTEERTWATLVVGGFRWEGRADFRQEFIWNGSGYTDKEWDDARSSVTTLSPNLAQNIERFFRPGLEFRRQAYSYTSLRIPTLGPRDNIGVAARLLASLRENSSLLQLGYEHEWNDRTVISAESVHMLGDPAGEFRMASDSQISLGFRQTY